MNYGQYWVLVMLYFYSYNNVILMVNFLYTLYVLSIFGQCTLYGNVNVIASIFGEYNDKAILQ
jgi:hypothetical protein